MKIIIGITQNIEYIMNFIAREFKGTGTTTEIGPFKSYEDATQWEIFMTTRAAGNHLLPLPQQLR